MRLSCQECLATLTVSTLTPTRISRRLLVVGVREMVLLVALEGQQFAKKGSVMEGGGVVELEEVEIWLVG